jgi:hypothetical protein
LSTPSNGEKVMAYNTLGLVDQPAFTLDHPELVEVDRWGHEVTFHAGDRTQHFIDTGLIAYVVLASATKSGGVAGPNRDEWKTKSAQSKLAQMQCQPHPLLESR